MKSIKHQARTITAAIALAVGLTTASAAVSTAQANNIPEVAAQAGIFNTLLAAVEAAGLADALTQGDPLTVFAPTDDAFAQLPEGTVESLLLPENRDQLVGILTYHVLGRELRSDQLPGRTIPVKPLNDAFRLRVTKSHGAVTVDNAQVIQADIRADNGVIHAIDTVLIPGSNTH